MIEKLKENKDSKIAKNFLRNHLEKNDKQYLHENWLAYEINMVSSLLMKETNAGFRRGQMNKKCLNQEKLAFKVERCQKMWLSTATHLKITQRFQRKRIVCKECCQQK